MKTVYMQTDYRYRAKRHVVVHYLSGYTYKRVPEAAVRAITIAKAGKIIEEEQVE